MDDRKAWELCIQWMCFCVAVQALEKQYFNKAARVDPDSIFPEVSQRGRKSCMHLGLCSNLVSVM